MLIKVFFGDVLFHPREKINAFMCLQGITYDTGGADIKAGGVMAGMSRDKGGASAVAGFMKVIPST